MPNKNTEPLIIVQNPNSTNFKHVEDRVIQPLQKARIDFEVYQTQHPDAEDNVQAMIDALPDNATVLSAAGDGTGEQVANASLQGDKRLTIGFLPFGNFNDMAYTHMNKNQTVLDLLKAPTIERKPMSIDVNGEHWRYAPAYITLGLTARIAAGFDDDVSREKMQRASKPERVARRLGQALSDYFKYSQVKIPAFRVNGGPVIDSSTDIAIANNPIAAGMIRPSEHYYDTSYFGARADLDMGNFFQAVSFGAQSLTGHSPLERMQQMHITFENAATVPAQTEGEYVELQDVRDIFVYKDPNAVLRVLHAKRN